MSRRALALLALGVLVAGLGLARAVIPDQPATLQERVASVSKTIRCPTCQGLSIQDSSSVLAGGARQIVREQLQAGRTPDQVRQYFVDRYGPSAVLSPDPAGAGLLAWAIPVLALPLAAVYGWRRLRRPRSEAVPRDGGAEAVLADYRSGVLRPDATPAGEALREALVVAAAADEDGVDEGARAAAHARLAAAARRYERRTPVDDDAPSRTLSRRAVTALTVVALLAGSGVALGMGVRDRRAGFLPTGDLPGGPVAQDLSQLLAATRERPQDPRVWVSLGQAYDERNLLVDAVRSYDRALALRPADDDVRLLRTAVLVRGGSAREALPVLLALAKRRPDDPDILLVLGSAQDILKRPEAEATLRRYLELAPDAPAAALVRQRLAQR